MSATFRTLVIGASAASRNLLTRLIDGSDIVIDDVVAPEQIARERRASVRRTCSSSMQSTTPRR